MEKGHIEKRNEISPWPPRLGHGGDIHIPLDLTVEILKKLPAKSLVRFRSVSKQLLSIISSRDFIEAIVTRSLTQPQRDAHIFYPFSGQCLLALSTTTCHRNTDKELLSVLPMLIHQPVRGLICCWSRPKYVVAIYNPTTRQTFYLPEVHVPADTNGGSFLFGYDPLENQYKVLFLPIRNTGEKCQVFTLGDGRAKQWRTIQSFCGCYLGDRGVCINGTIYYQELADGFHTYKLTSFDVRSERFYHVEAPTPLTHSFSTLINYQGKLGFICCKEGVEIWVMETQGWSKIFFYEMEGFEHLCVSGVTRDGEIVLNKLGQYVNDMFCVYYYDPKRNSMRYVDMEDFYTKTGSREGLMRLTPVVTFPGHVENTMWFEI